MKPIFKMSLSAKVTSLREHILIKDLNCYIKITLFGIECNYNYKVFYLDRIAQLITKYKSTLWSYSKHMYKKKCKTHR